MLVGAKDVIRRHGPERVTPETVCAAAGVERAMFGRAFAGGEDCLLALYDTVADQIREELARSYHAEACWTDSLRAALTWLLAFLDGEPRLARFLILGGVSADSALVARRQRLLDELAAAVDAGAPVPAPDSMPAPFGSEALVRTAASVVHARLLEEPVPSLTDLVPSLMAVLVLPFLGEHGARAELDRPAAPPEGRSPRVSISRPDGEDHLLRASLGPRSIAVLEVIATTPGISNRHVAETSGGLDEGQVSRMLARLSRHGLIANDSPFSGGGSRNAWRITAAGLRVVPSPGPHRMR